MEMEHKDNKILWIVTASMLILTFLLICTSGYTKVQTFNNSGKASAFLTEESLRYPYTLFDDTYVHNIDIQVDPKVWNKMTHNAQLEEYIPCTLVIDGVKIEKAAIRPKGNSSLKQISGMNSQNFSFKVEFDHYVNQTFDGLDKMALNNFTQDPTYLKDYLTYHMMRYMGVPAPLASFADITLNGQPFGFYLAVEAVEESFCVRNYKSIGGKLYKPDSLSLENFDFGKMTKYRTENGQTAFEYLSAIVQNESYLNADENTRVDMIGEISKVILESNGISTDVSGLVYIGDNPKNYKAIFDTAVFTITEKDKKRLIDSIKKLNKGEDLDNVIDIEPVIKYFVVHNFVNNYDGYTSLFSHNYYLYEENGKLSMIPWDYNLAYGVLTIEAGNAFVDSFSDYIIFDKKTYGMSSGKSMVNYPIDTPVFTVSLEERPMIYQVIKNEKYYELYHKYYHQFIAEYFESGYFDTFYSKTVEMISPYVKKDVKGFSTYEQFEVGTRELRKFCRLRAESIRGQLNKTIPATLEGQRENFESLIDVGDLDIMKTLDFSNMISVMGSSTEEVNDILKTIIGYVPEKYLTDGKLDTTKITGEDIAQLKNNIRSIVPIIFQIVNENSNLKKSVIGSVLPILLLILSFVAIIILMVLLNRYSRFKYKTLHRRENI